MAYIHKRYQMYLPLEHKFNTMNICIYCGIERLFKTIDNKSFIFYKKSYEKNFSLDKPFCG